MQRRKGRDAIDSLELGNQFNYASSIPMKKLTKMKVVKYLILIIVGILIHTTYRLLWRADSNISEETNRNYEHKVDSEIRTFKEQDVDSNIDTYKEQKELEDSNRKLFKDFIQNEKDEKKSEITLSPLSEKKKRYENFKKVIEKAKNEIHVEQIIDTDTVVDLEQPEQGGSKDQEDVQNLDQLEVVVDKRREAMELEKEHEIESKIAEVLSEFKVSEETKEEAKQETNAEPDRPIVPEEFRPNSAENGNKVPTVPAPDKNFLKKANKVVEKMSVENKIFVDKLKHNHDHGVPELVTAASSRRFEEVKQLVFSLQKFYPNEKIYIFDLDLTDAQRRHLMAACNVRMREFWSNLFPDFVSNFEHYHWRPLIIQTALAEFGHILWINTGNVVISGSLSTVLKQSTDLKVKIFGENAQHTTFAVTQREMYKYLPTDKKKLYNSPHMEIHAMVLHNTPELVENFLKLLVACAMEPKCLAPPSSKWQCDFDFSGKKYADCHRYDESAMNIILKNWYNFDNSQVLRTTSLFRAYDPSDRMSLKMCRDENDMRRN